jgi:hydroxymethylbilane synthase
VNATTPLRIATRRSPLALWQAEHVATALANAHPALAVEFVPLSTRGDEILDRSLAAIGGKGLFLKELEVAIRERRADLAVHSMKDVPAKLDPEFALASVLERADVADAFVSHVADHPLALPAGSTVATSSLRRQLQLKALRPDLVCVDVRGNVDTRLAKLDRGEFDAMILACAGLERLGLGERIRARLSPPDWLPAVAQGALAIEYRRDDAKLRDLLAPLIHPDTATRCAAERAMNAVLEGSCDVPIAAYAAVDGHRLELHGAVGDPSSGKILRAHATGTTDQPEELGRRVARALLDAGAALVLASRPRP